MTLPRFHPKFTLFLSQIGEFKADMFQITYLRGIAHNLLTNFAIKIHPFLHFSSLDLTSL